MSKECNCSPERRVNGTHYTWCASLEGQQEVVEPVPESKECDCDSLNRHANHYSWCASQQ